MNDDKLKREILEGLSALPMVDVHTHLVDGHLGAKGLHDILLYHMSVSDLYAAGFLYGLTEGLPLETCGRLGSLAAAEVIGHIGARPEASLRELAQERGLLSA